MEHVILKKTTGWQETLPNKGDTKVEITFTCDRQRASIAAFSAEPLPTRSTLRLAPRRQILPEGVTERRQAKDQKE